MVHPAPSRRHHAEEENEVSAPDQRCQVNQYITALADAKFSVDRAIAKANEKVTAINAALADELAPHEQIIHQHASTLFAYFEANKDSLTDGGKRESCVFATGVLGQRRTPPRTKITDEEAVLEYLRTHLLTEFYQDKPTLRRDAMLSNPSLALTVPGVAIVQDRIVYVKPDEFDVTIDLQKKTEPAK